MIDLAQALPTELVVGGVAVPVHVGWRRWLVFGRALAKGVYDWRVLAEPEAAPQGWGEAAREFWASPTACPHAERRGGARTLDLDVDGELVVAAFQQAYGIDLTSSDADGMHWHRFLALLRGIPQETKLAQVESWRGWSKAEARRRPEAAYEELRAAWSLPEPGAVSREEALAEQEALVGGVVERIARQMADGAGEAQDGGEVTRDGKR